EESDAKDDSDTYYDFEKLTKAASWLDTLAWFFLVAAGLTVINGLRRILEFVPTDMDSVVLIVLSTAQSALIAVLFFAGARGFSQLIYVLMDIENNTRKSTKARQ